MKFAKELERDAVPEWRIKYLNYKAGKKHVKAVGRALARANGTPRGLGPLRTGTFASPPSPRQAFTREGTAQGSATINSVSGIVPPRSVPTPRSIPTPRGGENDSLTDSGDNRHYGSFVETPPEPSPLAGQTKHHDFQLPAPALKVHDHEDDHPGTPATVGPTDLMRRSIQRLDPRRTSSASIVPTASTITSPAVNDPSKTPRESGNHDSPSQLRRLFTHQSTARSDRRVDINMQNLDLVREREREFFDFLDSELAKVDGFYRMKEEQAGQRLDILRTQLHEMRNRRIQEMADERSREENHHKKGPNENGNGKLNGIMDPIKAKIFPVGPNSKALQKMGGTPNANGAMQGDAERDYIRRPEQHDVSYRTAKRKLKLALQEFYRGLELLKSFAMLNRTAFRKLNKKYDKAVNARPPYRYLNEKVNQSWFVNSDVLEGHIRTVEDLYARYFERGNHKLAAGKLRSLNKKPEDQSIGMFQNGLLIGTGAVFAIQGLIYGAQLLYHEDDEVRVRTSYLMQIYGGYFLMLYLFALFCIDCMLWNQNKVNYPFIFEFDQRHHLDWRELAQFPSFFFLVLGLFMWVNFSRYGDPDMYIYYPVILIFFTVVILFFPAPTILHRSRRWFAYSHWRLLLAGLYPVEFRDFFLGDIYCSLTYSTANIELFFCLYANYWQNPVQCNSSHSRALGFLTALPPIWRFLQCLRRYKDTRNVFPHLVNGGKYTATITAAVMLSLYRIHNSTSHLALFITFSTINSVYCSFWDLFMDFSLLQSGSRHWGLRDILALKRRWLYYFIMVVDPILRFAWIFYAIFTHNTQHSTIVSFMVAFMEVTRRGMWTLFRVENEHCGNVSQYKASRDVPLPYNIEPLMARASMDGSIAPQQPDGTTGVGALETPSRQGTAQSTGVSLGQAEEGTSRRRTGTAPPPPKRTLSRMLAEAHKQDFEKKRRPLEQTQEEQAAEMGQSDDDDDDADEAVSLLEITEAEELARGSSSRYR
ncbi:Xenotropic and polytropic retrovirus receptor 1 [Fusarium torreyae]|uniref:Xenotropic and polytropic retrovirus receptor 1 n=1 Tax=Fusarium torreyae TaxID=1237075 RepID=A0A9W8RWZ3_9HYPO|nr:Xenotropic and polytropic retrovirus receptor 1 [Fusarium torreyae]